MEGKQSIDALCAESWKRHGRRVTFYLPGMFRIGDERGEYPALSITGKACDLMCGHCGGRLLQNMADCSEPRALLERCLELDRRGFPGCLITGGSTVYGAVPWSRFIPVLKDIVHKTSLTISVHSGLVDEETVHGFRDAGVHRVLVDVVGSDETLESVYNLSCGIKKMEETLRLLTENGLDLVPHIIMGIDNGRIKGEYEALRITKKYNPAQLCLVTFMPLPETPLGKCAPPDLEEVKKVMAFARELFIDVPVSLGCGRPRGDYSMALERFALDVGINRVALWNDETLDHARALGLEIEFMKTCCAV